MIFDPATLDNQSMQKILVGGITPRPIAWISTLSIDGINNIAPYSFFTVASTNPPVLCFTQIMQQSGSNKDTLGNLLDTKECVVHIVNSNLLDQMNLSCKALPPNESEFDFAKITTCPSHGVAPLSVKDSPVRYECTLRDVINISTEPAGGSLVLLDVKNIYINDALLNDGMINQKALDSVGKMGGNLYSTTNDLIDLARP